ncbi:MAG: hypothetical protein LBS01_01060 [Prevotellaceae bacterium]|nr:hypothetical protein [Prevotellaceae bacterium]
MKKLLLLTLIILSFTSCRTKYFCTFSSSIVDVQPANGIIDTSKNKYEDEHIEITWTMIERGFAFKLFNKSNNPLIIDWNKISYINTDGVSESIIHTGVKYIKRYEQQQSSTIPPHASIVDILTPADNVYYYNYGQFGSGWSEKNLFPYYTKNTEERNSWKKYFLGKSVSIYFPLQTNEQEIVYTFIFKIDRMHVIQHNPDKKYIATETQDFPLK